MHSVDTWWQQYITHSVDTWWQQYISHLHTNNTQNTEKGKFGKLKCGPCPVFASYTLAFALQLRKKHRKTSVRIASRTRTMDLKYTEEKLTKHRTTKNTE
jgi:hypothetical protein